MGAVSSQKAKLSRVLLAAAVVGAVIMASAVMLIAWAAMSIDRLEQTRERSLVERRTQVALERVVSDINSAAIWNDAVVAMSGTPDLEWLQVNFGDYFADYMDHTATLVLSGDGEVVLASRDSEPVDPVQLEPLRQAAAILTARVRDAGADPARRAGVGFDGAAQANGLVSVDGQVWLVGVATITPEDDGVTRPASDPIVISGYPVERLVGLIQRDLNLKNVAFVHAPATPGEATLALSGPSGEALGLLSWTPERVGFSLLTEGARIMAWVIALLVLGWAWLMLWLRRTANAMAAAEADLVRAKETAEAANEAKSRFLANVSHELRTPLNGVVGIAEVMATQSLAPDQKQYLDLIRASGARLTELIEELLQLSRLERGQLKIQSAPFDLDAVVETVERRHRAAARAKGVDFELRTPRLGRRQGDAAHLTQALNQLMENAVAYTSAGRVALKVTDCGDLVRFSVEDTGPGLDPRKLAEVFGLFVQGDDSLTKSADGLGAGLPLCRMLATAMDGRVLAESTPGHGSRFTLELPLPRLGRGTSSESVIDLSQAALAT